MKTTSTTSTLIAIGLIAGSAGCASDALTINGQVPSQQALAALSAARGQLPAGDWWYDSRSGLYGMMGKGASGVVEAGYDFGPLPRDASSGSSGIFFNGRQLTALEAAYVLYLFGIDPAQAPYYAGEYLLEATGDLYTAQGVPVGNLYQRAQQSGGSGGSCEVWSSRLAAGNSCGGCSYVNVGGSFATSGCG
jgi:hypothetical protein